MANDRQFWADQATNWLERFCVDGIDPWGTEFNLPTFFELIPEPVGIAIDVGCGDGRVGEMLRAGGHGVIGLDGAAMLARATANRGIAAAEADGGQLPIRDEAAALTVSSMVLMDIDDLDAHVGELARITQPGGVVCVAMLHPIRTAGRVLHDGVFSIDEYLAGDLLEIDATRNGGAARLRWWRRPMSDYLTAFIEAGLTLDAIREPVVPDWFVEQHGGGAFRHVPMFLHLRFIRTA